MDSIGCNENRKNRNGIASAQNISPKSGNDPPNIDSHLEDDPITPASTPFGNHTNSGGKISLGEGW